MINEENKNRLLSIISEGINILSNKPEYRGLVVMCRALKSKVGNGSQEMQNVNDLQDFFELEMFLKFELNNLARVITDNKSAGLRMSEIDSFLPEFATKNTPLRLKNALLKSKKFVIKGDSIYNIEYAPQTKSQPLNTVREKNKNSLGTLNRKLTALNGTIPATALKSSIDSAILSKVYPRLLRKIEREFDKKFFIGDIAISDLEYVILCEFLAGKCKMIIQSKSELTDCPAFAVALVQIGIRKYQGNKYWPFVSREIGIDISQYQGLIGRSFISTLKCHGKYVQSESERVASILFHTFVSDYYSRGLFELLFQYFDNDLERDINRNSTEQMHYLMETLALKSELSEEESESFTDQFMGNGSKAYKLKQHTLQAISANQSHSSARLRRFIRMIDRAFWKETVPKNPTSRLSILFKEWVNESESFRREYRQYKIGAIRNRGKKHFSSPYLFADISSSKFSLKLPAQIVKEEYADNLKWKVTTSERTLLLSTDTYPALTGYKTVEKEIEISKFELFGAIDCQLECNDKTVRSFGKLEKDGVRFFDMEGDYAPKLFRIPMCAYTLPEITLKSPALVDKFKTGGMMRWDFEFDNGDIVFLPDSKSMIVGEHYYDGFSQRGRINDCQCFDDNQGIDVYKYLPNLILTIPKSKIAGTELMINSIRYKLGECDYIEFESYDSSGERAFYLELNQFKEVKPWEINTFCVDAPGSNFARFYRFAYAPGLSADFEGAPYVFEQRGAVVFSVDEDSYECATAGISKLRDCSGLEFVITPELMSIDVKFKNKLLLNFTVPVFMWSTDKIRWHTEPVGELWHTDFFKNNYIYFKSPTQIELSTDDDEDRECELDDRHAVTASIRADGLLEADLTRFRSWLRRDKLKYPVKVQIGSRSFVLAEVYTKSYAAGCELTADYEAHQLILHCNIIGMSKHFVDIQYVNTGEYIAEKSQISGGETIIPCEPKNGILKVTLYESDEDDSGFDDIDYLPFYEYKTTIINKNDFTGQNLKVIKFSAINGNGYQEPISGWVYITRLIKTGKNEYDGLLSTYGRTSETKVHVVFLGNETIRSFELYFYDEDDLLDFEFDCRKHTLITDDTSLYPNLRGSERYRRFIMLYNEEYNFFGQLEDSVPPVSNEIRDDGEDHFGEFNIEKATHNPLSMRIDELGLKVETYERLKSARLETVFALTSITEAQLRKIDSLKNRHIEEIRAVLHRVRRDFRK